MLHLGNLEEGLFTGDSEGWMKELLFPSLRGSTKGALGRAPLLGNLKDEVFEGSTKCPAGRPSSI
jgi:hypothetical protein